MKTSQGTSNIHRLPEAGRREQARRGCEACPVRETSMCAALDDSRLEVLDTAATRLDFGPDETLLFESDPADHAFNITNGVVRVSKMLPDGRRQITGFLHPGDFLGLSYQDCYAYSAEAVTPVKACRFRKAELNRIMRDNPELEHRLLSMANNELALAHERMLLLGRKSAAEKVASFLLSLPRHPDRIDEIDLPMTRGDIADYLGLTLETVSRTLSGFVRQQIVRNASPRIVMILDMARLSALAAGEGE